MNLHRVCFAACCQDLSANPLVGQLQQWRSGTGKGEAAASPSFRPFAMFRAIDWVRGICCCILLHFAGKTVTVKIIRFLRVFFVAAGRVFAVCCSSTIDCDQCCALGYVLPLLLQKREQRPFKWRHQQPSHCSQLRISSFRAQLKRYHRLLRHAAAALLSCSSRACIAVQSRFTVGRDRGHSRGDHVVWPNLRGSTDSHCIHSVFLLSYSSW